MNLTRLLVILASTLISTRAADLQISDDLTLQLPEPGAYELRILSPTMLELVLVNTKKPDPSSVENWDFVNGLGRSRLPKPKEFKVLAAGKEMEIKAIGFKRRVLYAPFKQRDLRIANYLYLQLGSSVTENDTIEVRNPGNKLWTEKMPFSAKATMDRWSPIIHVNQTGYLASYPKKAMVGYYLGSLGEMELTATNSAAFRAYQLIDAQTGKVAFEGTMVPRLDRGYTFATYQQVLEADFSTFKTPGDYRLKVVGLGVSYPFAINDSIAGAFARTYALGLYHQRCGMPNELPFTRFTHKECHVAPAEVPKSTKAFQAVNDTLAKESADYKDNPRHVAPQLKNVGACLYPFQNAGPIDTRGGHHDAGDYSKYVINSSAFIHQLVFAADVFPGVADLDNLGIPESGDGKSDILQEAKWEADFLAKMQDADGGFYFLVYPRDREYELDVTPDRGDPQVVFPKNTAATAAATAAMAQCASSPTFKKQFPDAAAHYLEIAKKGWQFLERAQAKYAKDGAYQKITHYGDYFQDDDEKAWAACELFLATGDESYQKKLMEGFDPANPDTRMWNWWRLFDAYGNTIRSYAFAVKAGKIKREQLNQHFLVLCETEIAAAGEDQLRRAQNSAYGTSFPEETKRVRNAGWYFSGDAAFDLAVALQLDYPSKNDPRVKMLEALITNLDYEEGCNPVNITYLTGLGWRRQREIVHQYAQNDRRVLPPTGIPLGNVQAGFGWLELYKRELATLSFPSDSDEMSPYPFYDRWGDSFNLSTEFTILNQARSLGYTAWLMASTPLKNQAWKAVAGLISVSPEKSNSQNKVVATLNAPGVDLSFARIVWEANGQDPVIGPNFTLSPSKGGDQWIEAEAQLPDGRRVFAAKVNITVAGK